MKRIKINGKILKVEVVTSQEKQHLGLSGRKKLCSNCGMLFEFETASFKTFTMRGMNFPLDMVWVNGNEIVNISEKVLTDVMHIKSEKEVDKVLELPSGTCERNSIKIGDKIE